MAKISRPILYLVIIGLGAVAYVYTEPEAAGPRAKTKAKAPAKKDAKDGFQPEDYTAKFAPVNMPVRDAFQPGVARKASGGVASVVQNGIPSVFTGGDPNWIYTGNAEQDGEVLAVLENPVSGEGEFVRRGDRWKLAVIEAIGPDSLTLKGNNGMVKTVQMGVQNPQSPDGELAPVNPALSGEIGGVTVTPNPNQPAPAGGQRGN